MSAQIAKVVISKAGGKPQQIQNAVSLSANSQPNAQYKVDAQSDVFGLTLTFSVATAKGTGIYAAAASGLSALTEIIIQARDGTTLHDFKTPNVDLPRVAFMFDTYYRRGGYYWVDTSITVDGTVTVSINLYAPIRHEDFPLTISIGLAALSALYSTVGTGTATVSTTVTPIAATVIGQFGTDYSVEFALSGLSAANNDVTNQMLERQRIVQIGMALTTEADLIDITLQTATFETLSLPRQNMKNSDLDTISGHTANFLRLDLRGARVALSKSGMTFKINEGTADQPTIYLIGQAKNAEGA